MPASRRTSPGASGRIAAARAEGFTKRYGLKLLVWYETRATMEQAISREKQIKAWKRAWKVKLIERMNPTWAAWLLWPPPFVIARLDRATQ